MCGVGWKKTKGFFFGGGAGVRARGTGGRAAPHRTAPAPRLPSLPATAAAARTRQPDPRGDLDIAYVHSGEGAARSPAPDLGGGKRETTTCFVTGRPRLCSCALPAASSLVYPPATSSCVVISASSLLHSIIFLKKIFY